jgi:hypothetical protein
VTVAPDPASGIAEDGKWTPAFEGQRRPFGSGPENPGFRHGVKSVVSLSKRGEEIRAEVIEVAPVLSEADGPAVDLLAICIAQVELAALVIGRTRSAQLEALRSGRDLTPEQLHEHSRLAQDARGWINSCSRLLRDLGMTPASRAALGVDLARVDSERQLAALREQGRQIRERLEAEDSAGNGG